MHFQLFEEFYIHHSFYTQSMLDVHRKKFSIYLRLGKTWASSQNKSIVIAKLCFEKERSGYGSA
ncbi:hypothetical protein ACSLOX_25085, partial [Escherichia coli]